MELYTGHPQHHQYLLNSNAPRPPQSIGPLAGMVTIDLPVK
jgi:hypothetical protein